MKRLLRWMGAAALALAGAAHAAADGPWLLLDDLRDAAAWRASASDQVRASLRRDADGSLCLDHDFAGVSGYAVMRRELPLDWPAHFELRLRLKGSGAVNDLQLKWVDDSGDNVWWVNRRSAQLPATLQPLRLRERHVDFAWGPASDRRLRRTRFVELVVAAGRDGGRGSVCLARLERRERAADPAVWPAPRLRAQGDTLHIDLGLRREFNGLLLHWPQGARPEAYTLQAQDEAGRWRPLRRVWRPARQHAEPDALFLPETEARRLRLRVDRGAAPLPTLALRSAAQWPELNAVIAERARALPRGDLPRAFLGEQNHWTLVGVDGGGQRSALLDEDGALELGRGAPSLVPAVRVAGDAPLTWAQVQATQSLRDGQLPLPAVHWRHADFHLDIEAGADGPAAAPQLLARYTLRNTGTLPRRLELLLALRPWQVNPPQQFLSTPGGAAPLARLRHDGAALQFDARGPLRFSAVPARIHSLPWDGGLGLSALLEAPGGPQCDDAQGHASALAIFPFELAPGESATLALVMPLQAGADAASAPLPALPLPAADVAARLDAAARAWAARLGQVELQLPGDDGQRIVQTLRASLAHMLLSRDGPALRPGTRSYARTWVRDGAMMVAGLVRLGERGVARDFTDWYAGHVFASGKVPCCVDERGADPVVENDSHGQYLFSVAELLRHGEGADWARRHWPVVQRVMAWMEALRQSERGEANRAPGRGHFFGLMPPSISHEGYADKPAYSYWDDFWALRGYKDAVAIAQALGQADAAARWAGWRDEFERELSASVAAAMRHHGIPFIPGAADRGDFDATSTTMALNPAQAALPAGTLQATFERYWQEAQARIAGSKAWADYTPYELRNVGALARLGQPERAHALLAWFFGHQRPAAWRQWAEVVLPDARQPRFLGDMPHAWVSSDFVRSALDLLAYEDEAAQRLVLLAGARADWLRGGDLRLRGLSTAHGPLDLALRRTPGGWRLELPLPLRDATARLRLRWPEGLPLPQARLGERTLAWQGRELDLPAPPLTLELLNASP